MRKIVFGTLLAAIAVGLLLALPTPSQAEHHRRACDYGPVYYAPSYSPVYAPVYGYSAYAPAPYAGPVYYAPAYYPASTAYYAPAPRVVVYDSYYRPAYRSRY